MSTKFIKIPIEKSLQPEPISIFWLCSSIDSFKIQELNSIMTVKKLTAAVNGAILSRIAREREREMDKERWKESERERQRERDKIVSCVR